MPVKWTPETDQILLLKILETSDVTPKCGEIAAKWPDSLDRPTPRAISERIVKIRALAKASGSSAHFTVPTVRATPSTPRKNATNGIAKKSTPKKMNGAKVQAGKRKRNPGPASDNSINDDLEASDEMDSDGTVSLNGASDDIGETPRKKSKSKANTTAKSVTDKELNKVKREEEENGSFPDNDAHGYETSFGGDGTMDLSGYA